MEYCMCGCGGELDPTKGRKVKKFLQGHSARINNKGGESRKGKSPWNCGIPRTDVEKENISKSIIEGKKNSSYVYTEDHKKNISKSLKGKEKNKEWVNKIIESRNNNPKYEQSKKQISETLKAKYNNGELISSFYIDGRYKNNPESNFNLYGGEFTDELKKEIRLRDKFECQLCNKKRSAVVHHIDHNKLNNNKTNLITLCRSCHSRHHNKGNLNLILELNIFLNIIKKHYEISIDL